MPTIHRFYVSPEQVKGNRLALSPEESRHAIQVLRHVKGDVIQCFDGQGRVFRGRIESARRDAVTCVMDGEEKVPPVSVQITLGQAVLKREAMDWLVEKSAELGVHTFQPLVTARTVVRSGQDSERWRRISLAAAKQCERAYVMRVAPPIPFVDVVQDGQYDGLRLLCLERSPCTVKACLQRRERPISSVLIFIGPEGGWTPQEVQLAEAQGVETVGLGSSILTAETAAISALNFIHYETVIPAS